MKSDKRTIAVDFDKTITVTDDEYSYGTETPNPEVIEWLREMYYAGMTIIVWTARPWSEANIIAARLTEWDVNFHGVRCGKGGADVYVDDKAVNHTDDDWRDRAESVMNSHYGPVDTSA